MTNERIIELLEIEKECVLRNACGECNRACHICELVQDDTELHEMYAEVIARMKAQEPCEDAVSKQTVISALEGEYSDWNDDYNIPITHCIKAVQSLPSVQLVPVARVMTLDLPPEEWQDKVIWLEIKGKKPIPCLFRKCCDRMMFGRYERIMSFDAIGSSKEGGYFLRNYGVNWRCWTSRPDEKRRAETPWDC